MSCWIAQRDLEYSPKGSSDRFKLSICISAPFELAEASLNFSFQPGAAGCTVQTFGLPKDVTETTYGADSIQALELACNVDGMLRRFRRDFDLYFPDGEPYFED